VYNHLEDHEWLAQVKEGQTAALTCIYRKYWRRLYVSAHAILKDEQTCEDIIQEIFLKLWQNRERIEIKATLVSYLYSSVRYEVYRHIKTGKVREDIFDHIFERMQAGPDYPDLEYKELYTQIHTIVESLPERCKAVYKLSREEHLSHKQIAAQLNISTKTVENQLTKALSLLRLSLGQVLTLELLVWLLHS
jgi:RNA polymerase sigma-70 factor (ECF subfamily)